MLNFILYMVAALGLLAVFMLLYERFTPYRELAEIRNGNVAAAIAYTGAILGFTIPLVSVIFFTHDILEMLKWGVITGLVQMALFTFLQRTQHCGEGVQAGNVASGILLGGLSVSLGLLNAICISY